MIKTSEQIKAEWLEMNDIERWRWIINNQDQGLIVQLDNDLTFIIREDDEDFIIYFDGYIGWVNGVEDLLTALKVKAWCV